MKNNTIFYGILIIILILIIFLFRNNIESFQNNTEIILKANDTSGFFSNFNKLITYLVDYPNTTKIVYNVRSPNKKSPISYIKENEELFTLLFNTYDEGTEIQETIEANTYKRDDITGVKAYHYYNENRYKLLEYNQAYIKYIHIKPHIQEIINSKLYEMKENYTNIIGIFIRSNALAGEQPSKRMPTRDEYMNAINNIKTPHTKYFLCIDNVDDLDYYKKTYVPNYYTDIRRTDNKNNGEPHTNTYGSLKDLQDSFIEVALLSQCDYLIHCVSNMATASLYMNMNQVSICVSK